MTEIRPITEEDIKQFEQEWEESDIEKGISPHTQHLKYGAFINEELVGYTKIKIRGGVGNLSALIIKKDMRKKGIGKTLLKHFEDVSKEYNCHKLTLKTSEKHRIALTLYKNNGYATEATMKNDKNHITWYQLHKYI